MAVLNMSYAGHPDEALFNHRRTLVTTVVETVTETETVTEIVRVVPGNDRTRIRKTYSFYRDRKRS